MCVCVCYCCFHTSPNTKIKWGSHSRPFAMIGWWCSCSPEVWRLILSQTSLQCVILHQSWRWIINLGEMYLNCSAYIDIFQTVSPVFLYCLLSQLCRSNGIMLSEWWESIYRLQMHQICFFVICWIWIFSILLFKCIWNKYLKHIITLPNSLQ